MKAKILGITKDGFIVVDRHNSHLHLDKETLRQVLKKIEVGGKQFLKVETKTPRKGLSYCVPVDNRKDKIYYKTRKGRKGPTKFVKGKKPIWTDDVTIILKRSFDGLYYVLISAFFGKAEPEPWDELAFLRDPRGYEAAKRASEIFWINHALIEEKPKNK